MKSYPPFIARHKRLLAFGMVMTFFSSFGQTFLISLFAAGWQDHFDLTSGRFGAIYSLATLISAALLPTVGHLIDTVNLRRYALTVATGLAVFAAGAALTQHWFHLFACLIGLRLTGQGLCGHVANTTMARSFAAERGKALSVSALGFPIGEAILPSLVVLAIAAIGWRQTWLLQSAIVAAVFIPLIAVLCRGPMTEPPQAGPDSNHPGNNGEKQWTRAHLFRDPRFYLVLPNYLIIPFAVTGLIIHQVRLAEYKSWTLADLAYGFVGFAILRIFASLWIGPMIDRFGARRLFPFAALPMAAGIAAVARFDPPLTALLYLSLTGASMGAAGALGTALWVELYGIRHLGAIKSLSSSFAIFGTALSPALFGWMLDGGFSFGAILLLNLLLILLALLISLPVCLGNKPYGR